MAIRKNRSIYLEFLLNNLATLIAALPNYKKRHRENETSITTFHQSYIDFLETYEKIKKKGMLSKEIGRAHV